MRVRIIRPFYFAKRETHYKENDIVDAPQEDAEVWLKSNMAMQDKSLDGGTETKDVPPPSKPKRKRKSKKKG